MMVRNKFLSLLILGASAISVYAQNRAVEWADSVMSTMTLRERIAQLFVPRLDIKDDAAGYALLHKMVVKEGVGGILLGKGKASEYVNVINRGQAEAKVPLMVTLDGEWGPAMRVSDAPVFPFNMALGAISDNSLIYEYGLEVARQCRILGIQVDFAPVLDVNNNPDNPVIGRRSFGENPDRVAALGAAFCRGLEAGGVMAVGKHFPGHGDTSVDSHKAIARVTHSRAQLEAVDFKPFLASMAAGMRGIMVGHLDVPALDASGVPASLSKKITTGVLQKELGFNGLIFTDALAMKGAVSRHGNNCVKAFQAGADVMLSTANPVGDIEAMAVAVNVGNIKQADIDSRCRKVLIAKYNMGLNRKPEPGNAAMVSRQLNSPATMALIDRLARASMTVLKNDGSILPLRSLSKRRIAVLNIGDNADNVFSAYCRRYADVECYGLTQGGIGEDTMASLDNADIVIAACYSNKNYAVQALNRLKDHRGLVAVFMMSPYNMAKFGNMDQIGAVVAAYGLLDAQQRAAAQALFGGQATTGRFPVNVTGVGVAGQGLNLPKTRIGFSSPAEEGMNANVTERIDSIVKQCMAARAFPGCEIAVVRNGNFVVNRGWGHLTYENDSPEVTTSTLYDLASMTKPIAIVSTLMKLYAEGAFRLDDKVSEYVPELTGDGREDITVRELLQHMSGLKGISINSIISCVDSMSEPPEAILKDNLYSPVKTDSAYMPVAKNMWCGDAAADSIMAGVYGAKMWPKKYSYSDLNFMLLNEMVQNISGISLDEFVATEVTGPIGAYKTGFNPSEWADVELIAPTEQDDGFRQQLLQGYVHDELAAFTGGVQGNAGLFGTAEDVAKLGQTLINGGVYGGERIFNEGVVDLFTSSRSKDLRALGFDTASRITSMSQSGANGSVYGHTGFTGTCFWVDPENALIYVFLCNRVYPTRDNKSFASLMPRVAVMRVIYESIK